MLIASWDLSAEPGHLPKHEDQHQLAISSIEEAVAQRLAGLDEAISQHIAIKVERSGIAGPNS